MDPTKGKETSAQEEATITVRRTAPDDVQIREVIVKLDGEQMGTLRYGESVSFAAAPGHHRLRVDNTFNWKTVELELKSGEQRKFVTKSRAGRFSWFLVLLLGAGPLYVSIEEE